MVLARAASAWAYAHLGGGRKDGWKCGDGGRACAGLEVRPTAPVEDDGYLSPTLRVDHVVGRLEQRNLVKGFKSLPRPLSVDNLSANPNNGDKVHEAYQGVPGAYSEAAVLKAYPQWETVPCDQFEAAFKASYCWRSPVSCSPLSSRVAWSEKGRLKASFESSSRKLYSNFLFYVIWCLFTIFVHYVMVIVSSLKALFQCETSLSKLGVIKERVDWAAKFVAENGLRETLVQSQVLELQKFVG